MNKKDISIGLLVAALVGLSFLYITKPVEKVTERIIEKQVSAGSVTGPEVFSDYFSIGGVVKYFYRVPMTVASTSLCSIKSPAATSTIAYINWIVNKGTTTAAYITIATSTGAYATSSSDELVADTSLASGEQGYVDWRSVGGGVQDNIISPSNYVLVKTAGAGLGGYTYTGYCQVEFVKL